MLATDKPSVDHIRREVESSESLLANFYAPWDADDSRPLWILKDALDAQQRALAAMLAAVTDQGQRIALLELELAKERRINAGARGRLNSLEGWAG